LKNKLCSGLEEKKEPGNKIDLQFLNEDFQACPECGSRMFLRVAKNGKNNGKKFYGCSKFPTCTATLPC